jgi:hypothetical protein
MRPGAFPTIRLAQLASLVQQSTHLFSRIVEAKDLAEVEGFFRVMANDYWHYHYTFEQTSPFKPKSLGIESINNLIINTVVPLLFAYGLHRGDESCKDKALRWLEELAPENNQITKGFAQLGFKSTSAYDSQALIELKNEYCSPRKCLQCSIGNSLLKKEVRQAPSGEKSAPF